MPTSLDLKPLDHLGEGELLELIEMAVAEWKTIDYKIVLPGKEDKERKEFLRDVSSFANASGGHLVFGIREEKGIPVEICGLPSVDPEAEILRLEEIVRMGIKPRIQGMHCRAIPVPGKGSVVVIRIPRTLNGPHQITFGTEMRFYSRGSMGKFPMDVDEIRTRIDGADSVATRLRNFAVETLSNFLAGDGPVPATRGGFIHVMALPLASFTGDFALPLALNGRYAPCTPPVMRWGCNHRFCFDGSLFISTQDDKKDFVLIRRTGIIESLEGFPDRPEGDKFRGQIGSTSLEQSIFRQIRHTFKIAIELEIPGPAIVTVAVGGMRGWKLGLSHDYGLTAIPFSRDLYRLPEQSLEGFEGDPVSILEAVVTPLWNEAGVESSQNFEKGEWRVRRD